MLVLECNGVKEFVEIVIDEGVVVVLGYSNVILEEVDVVVEVGVSVFVYVYNGMCGLNYCELGMVGVLLML